MASNEERRKYQRVTLVRPLVARIGAARVFLLEASLSGIRIAHQGNIPAEGSVCTIIFEWESVTVALECRITRNTLQKMARNANEKSVYHVGMEIVRASDVAMKTLRDLITAIVARALDEQKANARGIPAVAAQTFQTGKGTNFLRFEIVNGAWRRTETTRPDQPMNGFTISAEEDPDHIAILCETYLSADAEGRKLIKIMSELSISKAEGIPTRRYSP
ncbi:MAG: PilZ domain-containing protein [Thermoanaerobaculia bacterium]